LQGLGDVEGVLHEKSALLKALPRDGIAIVNYDDANCIRAAMAADCRIVSYGTDARCELRATNIRGNRWGTQFVLNGKHEFRMPLHGLHNVSNALAALAVGWVSGVNPYEMQIALRRILPVGRRLQYANLGGVHVLDDSYNANPASTKAALRTLAGLSLVITRRGCITRWQSSRHPWPSTL
jgi:UDP-N-acetylmuramyl pentapeptide synthase